MQGGARLRGPGGGGEPQELPGVVPPPSRRRQGPSPTHPPTHTPTHLSTCIRVLSTYLSMLHACSVLPTYLPTHPPSPYRYKTPQERWTSSIGPSKKTPKNYLPPTHPPTHPPFSLQIQDPTGEMDIINRALQKDAKNYHAWAYRQWLLKTFQVGGWVGEWVNNMSA